MIYSIHTDSRRTMNEAEQSYLVLINYLSLYVNMQRPIINKIIITISDNKYNIYDNKLNLLYTVSNQDNLLLDIVVTLAPKIIEFYNNKELVDAELLKVLLGIFKERIYIYNSI